MQSPFEERTATRFSFIARPSPVAFYPVVRESEAISSRELEVLKHVAEGLSNKEIASALDISAHTVARHVTNIMRKLDASNRAQAATMALRSGLLAL
jgi:DNA-binding NarL/FixJ family response regulator